MKNRKTAKVSIDIYDADGELCEAIGGPMDYEDVKEQMISALRNDGIPVIRRHAKHEKTEEQAEQPVAVTEWEQPMTVSLDWKGVHFLAAGKYEDVMSAVDAFFAEMRVWGG